MREISSNVVCFNTMIAGSFRSFSNMIISCYLPVFFSKVYPQYSTLYSILSAVSLMGFGFTSTMLGGVLSDRYGTRYPRTYSLICMVGALLAVPMIFIATMFQSNFWLSMTCCSLSILFSGSYFSPAITMM